MNARTLRARAVLSAYATVVVVALLALAGVGGVIAYDAHVDPGTKTVERSVDEWRLDGRFQHDARVSASASGTPFEPNETVENRRVYFERVMPVLDGAFVLAYDGNGPVRLHLDRRLIVESAESDAGGGGETVYWRRNRSLGSTTTRVAPGERATAPFAVNVSEAHREAQNVSERLDSPGEIRTRIVVDVQASRVNGGASNRTVSFALPIDPDRGVYRVGDGARSERFNRTETTTVPADPGPLRSIASPLVLFVALVGSVGVVAARRRGHLELSTVEREWLEYRTRCAEYEGWISEGHIPDDALDRPAVVLDTLDALVDVAIDTDERVLHDVDRDSYHVLDDDVRYVYETPTHPGADQGGVAGGDAVEPLEEGGERDATDAEVFSFGDEAAQDSDAILHDDPFDEAGGNDDVLTEADETTGESDDAALADAAAFEDADDAGDGED